MAIEADLEASPWEGEGYRKVWARLRVCRDIRVARKRVLRLGFLGVLIILRPGFEGAHWGASFALISAVSYALFQITTRMLGFTDRPWTTMFYTDPDLRIGALVSL